MILKMKNNSVECFRLNLALCLPAYAQYVGVVVVSTEKSISQDAEGYFTISRSSKPHPLKCLMEEIVTVMLLCHSSYVQSALRSPSIKPLQASDGFTYTPRRKNFHGSVANRRVESNNMLLYAQHQCKRFCFWLIGLATADADAERLSLKLIIWIIKLVRAAYFNCFSPYDQVQVPSV